MDNETLATEVIKEIQERLISVLAEIDCLDCDCDKAKFVTNAMLELIDTRPIETEKDVYRLQDNMEQLESLAGIAYDYIDKIQSRISNVVTRERKKGVGPKIKDK